MKTPNRQSMQRASGEQLLVLAVLGGEKVKPAIDHEFDRQTVTMGLATTRKQAA